MDQQDHEQLEEVEDQEYQRPRRPPIPVEYLAAITKLWTSCGAQVDQATAAFHETFGQAGIDDEDEDEEEYLKKLELLVKQRLHELEQERGCQRRQPHTSTILDGASTSTTDDHSGTSSGHLNEGGHSGSGSGSFFQKQVPANNEIKMEEEEAVVDVHPKLQAFVCFPSSLFPRRGYLKFYSPERLVFSKVVDDLDSICIEAERSCFFEEVVQRQINQVTSRFINIRGHLRDAYTEPAEVPKIEWLKVVIETAINTNIIINDLIVKMARDGGSKKLYHAFDNKYLVPLSCFNDEKTRRVAIKKLMKTIHDKIPEEYIDNNPPCWLMQIPVRHRDLGAPITSRTHPRLYDHIVGREKDVELIQKHLMSKEKGVQVISVVGMFGTGKTALAHHIYGQYSVVGRFDVFAWAQSGGEGGPHHKIRCLADKWSEVLGKAFREKVIDQIPRAKREMDDRIITTGGGTATWNHYTILHDDMILDLLRNHKYLLVIDDITTTEAWDEVRNALPMGTKNGSRILLTTRDTKVALHAIRHQPCSPPPHQLGPLNDAECWELFTLKVRHPSPLPLNLESVGKEIVKKCDGLPFAIEHIADHLLSTQETGIHENTWSNVLESTNKQLDHYHTPWSYLLNMIVKDLSLTLKWCLFYFGLFPKDYAIPVRRLIALWVAEGFMDQTVQTKDKTLEYIAEEHLQELIDLNMVQVTKQKSNGKPKRCCLTYYFREHLSRRGKQTNYASTIDESSTSRSNKLGICRLADHPGINRAMESPDSYRLLLSFLSFDHREGFEPGERIRSFLYGHTIKGHFNFLRVLDLECVYKPGLPKEMGKLIHLKYLGLRWTYLDSFPPFISNLINLQTLDIKHTYISTLPASIWKLRKLRHVCLNECFLDSFVHQPDEDFLENLQTLWGIHVDEESSVLEGLNQFTKITRLGVSCNLTSPSQQDAMADWISKLTLLESLRFRSKDRLGKLSVVHLSTFTTNKHLSDLYLHGQLEKLFEVNALQKLTELTLSASKLTEDPLPTLEKLPCLSILRLYFDSYLGGEMVCSPLGFTRLEELKIWKLENLKIWSVKEKTMPMLKKLEIRSCDNLESLPVGLQQITTLQELMLTDMPMKFTEEVKKDEDKIWYKKANVCFVDRRSSQV